MWIEVLRREVAKKGPKQVARELGVSRSTIDLVVQGKYSAGLTKINARIEAIYGHNGQVLCPILEEIKPARCADLWNKAKKIGMRAGNPETLKLYKTCLKCSVRAN